MIEMFYKYRKTSIPEEWNELTFSQLKKIVRVLLKPQEEMEGKLLLLKSLAKMSWWKFLRFPQDGFLKVLFASDFVLKSNGLTKQLLPKYKQFYGPGSGLDNLKIKEFVFTELYYSEYTHEKSKEALDKLIAVLYRPAKKGYDKIKNADGDIREAFNDNLTPHYTKKIQHWPEDVKQAILLWYSGCREALVRQYDNVFQGGDGEESKYGLWSLMRSVAKNGVFGDFDRVQEQYVSSILMDLDETVSEAKRIEEQTKA